MEAAGFELRSARRLIVLSVFALAFAVGALIATAVDVARWVDGRNGEIEQERVRFALAAFARLRPDVGVETVALEFAGSFRLADAHIAAGPPESPSEIGVVLSDGRFLVWAAPRVGMEARAQFAPRRIPLVVGATLVVAYMLYRLGRLATALDRERVGARDAARRDALTGIGNRLAFDEELNRRLGSARPFGLACLDLDGFKLVNDRYGHGGGDAVLAGVARRLRALTGAGDAVFRLGGDEFAVFLADDGRDLVRLARKIVLTVSDAYDLGDGSTARVGTCVGLAQAPRDGASPRDLLQAADAALYRAKAEGESCCRLAADAQQLAAEAVASAA